MGRRPIGERAMTNAERVRRHRAAKAQEAAVETLAVAERRRRVRRLQERVRQLERERPRASPSTTRMCSTASPRLPRHSAPRPGRFTSFARDTACRYSRAAGRCALVPTSWIAGGPSGSARRTNPDPSPKH